MALNTIDDIQVAYAKLEQEEEEIKKRIENHVAKQYQLEAMLKNISKSIPKLQEICADAEKLSEIIQQTANLAESVSEKVRRLDITRSRVSECQQRVHDLLDLQLAAKGVEVCLVNEDYEKAASHVHRFLSIDRNILKQTADDFAEDQSNVNNSFTLLEQVSERLRVVVTKKLNEAIRDEDLASVERFFKIYPLLNMHEEGINKYVSYLSKKLQDNSKNNLKTSIETNKYNNKPNIIFSDTLNSLLEGTARIIETCQPLVDTYYGPGRLVLFIEKLQITCDAESVLIIAEFIRSRQLDKKIRQVNEYENNMKTLDKLEAKSLGLLLTELTNMHAKSDLFFKFLKKRVMMGVDKESDMYNINLQRIDSIIEKCQLNRKMQEILGYYVLLERYFVEESVARALAMDTIQEGDINISSVVDDVFFIVRKAISRACSCRSLEGVCTVLNNISRILETEYCPALKQHLRQGYPSGYLDLTQAYNALQQGRLQTSDPEQTKLAFLAYLNDADLSLEYTEKLKKSVEEEISQNFPNLTEREKEKLIMCLSGLSTVSSALTAVIEYGVKQLKESAIAPRVSPWIASYLDHGHELSEEEFNNYEAGETFVQQLIVNIDNFLASFKGTLTQTNQDTLVNVLTTEIAKQLEKVVLKAKYNRLGGLVVDREIRALISFMTTVTSWSVREKFTRLTQIALLLNMERPSELTEITSLRLQPTEILKTLRRRTDFSSEELDSLKL